MTDRSSGGIKRWMGFAPEKELAGESVTSSNSNSLARIRELESQLAELRSRRDITSLSKEEFEILATETAMTLIRTAQKRESTSVQSAERVVSESKRSAQSAIEAAENKVRTILSSAEVKGRRLIEAAEGDAAEVIQDASRKAEELIATKRRDAMSITSAARKEAEQMIAMATSDVASYRAWLSSVVDEAERLYKVQVQSLAAASTAIEQSRGRLDAAWERLSQLSTVVERSIDETGKPRIPRREDSASASNSSDKKQSATSKTSTTSNSRKNASKSKKR